MHRKAAGTAGSTALQTETNLVSAGSSGASSMKNTICSMLVPAAHNPLQW